jgi:cytochrome c-type biogenesis protein CcmF
MLLGIDTLHIFNYTAHVKIGSNPFILLRKAFPNIPLFAAGADPSHIDYINKISDGRGLNVLLQNYWMVIHPPVLFLGFASTIVPFAFAMASLWNKRYTDWVRPALPWTVFGCMVLGTGILMGGAWAYEALSFGGFWAWDPVENASLVPWLIFIACLHTMLIYRSRKSSLGATYIFATLTFLLILYSTFLTRSGILGDTSVHSFTDLGLSGQLLIFMFVFMAVAIASLSRSWKAIPTTEKEESMYSREFWMFIGALILSLSALHIIAITSMPIYNKLGGYLNDIFHTTYFRTNLSKPTDPIAAYHMLEIPFAIMVAILTGVGQFFRYIKTPAQLFWRRVGISAAIAIVLAAFMIWLTELYEWQHMLLLWAAFFSIVANGDILLGMLRKKTFRLSGPAVAHIGFGLILAGALISNAKKQTISLNTEHDTTVQAANEKEQRENKTLYKDRTVEMGGYEVTYAGDSSDKDHLYYRVNYRKIDPVTKKITEEFNLYPYVIHEKNTDEFKVTSPSTKHYLTKDVFTHITAAPNKDLPEFQPKYGDELDSIQIQIGQTLQYKGYQITASGFDREVGDKADSNRMKIILNLSVTNGKETHQAHPSFIIENDLITPIDDEIKDFALDMYYTGIDTHQNAHNLVIRKGTPPPPPFIALKAMIFPFINLLWIGAIVMIIGFFISLLKGIREYRT